ncbi:MAG: CFI-box-CTERM domain-containing protein [Candidatus Nitrosotenuis sp.]
MLLAVASMAVLPAYANFVEFKTDKTSYKKGESIVFSGKADEEHAVKMVSVKIYGPKGEFVALISGRTDFDSILVINPLDTSKGSFASNSAKQGNGIYNATIIYDAEPTYVGKSLIFDFSLDGSPVIPSAADIMKSQTAQQPTQQPPAQQPTQQPTQQPQQPTQQPPAQQPPPLPPSTEPQCGPGTVLENGVCVVTKSEQQPKTSHIPGFPDPTKEPQYYVDRYNNEPAFKEWFDRNFAGKTVYQVLQIPEPEPEPVPSQCGPGTKLENGMCVLDETSGGGCLIATAAYGSELSPQVQRLREIRDNALMGTNSGSVFMSSFNAFYYSFSPTVADWERQNPAFKESVKIMLTPMLSTLSILNHVDIDSESKVIGYGAGLILLNVGIYLVAPIALLFGFGRLAKHYRS